MNHLHDSFMFHDMFLGTQTKMFKADTMRKEVYALILSQFFFIKSTFICNWLKNLCHGKGQETVTQTVEGNGM